MKKLSKRNWFRLIWFSLGISFFVWQAVTHQPHGVDPKLLNSDQLISVTNDDDKISFINQDGAQIEVLFFPGGMVHPEAYVPLARNIAEQGHNVHIIKMPWRMSTKGYNKINSLFDLGDRQKSFVLGGHSQGGKMAAQFVYENPGLISGLFLLGTSHPRDYDMSSFTIPTIKVYAEHDGLASVEEVNQNKNLLPSATEMFEIKGGNHSQFGYMGHLLMDDQAQISKEEQLSQTVNYLLKFLQQLET